VNPDDVFVIQAREEDTVLEKLGSLPGVKSGFRLRNLECAKLPQNRVKR
jgi:hypothetical protein